jgi:S-adenosyl methyltransferase
MNATLGPGEGGADMTGQQQVRPRVPAGVDPATPSPVRLYDYYLGGTNNFEADRAAAERLRAELPDVADAAWANRGFHGRAAIWLAQQGIRQFLDLGAGLPRPVNTHDMVRQVVPDARVAYVDQDPMVAALSDGLLADTGGTVFIPARIREPDGVLSHPALRGLLDLTAPVGLLITGDMQYLPDDADPWSLVARYVRATAPGSYLALSHVTSDGLPPQAVRAGLDVYGRSTAPIYPRSKAEVARFFAGLQIVPPYEGAAPEVSFVGTWGSEDPEVADSDGSRVLYCAVARRP